MSEHQRRVRARDTMGAALLIAALLGAPGCGRDARAGKSGEAAAGPAVSVMQAQRIEMRREVEAIGTLSARDQAVVSAEVAGRVARLAADMGDRVTAGTPLVFLDAEKLQYRADEQQAALQQTRARLGAHGDQLPPPEQTPDILSAAAKRAEAEQQLQRARKLAAEKLVPPEELERAETQVQTARAAHASAIAAERELRAQVAGREATLRQATRELHDAVIRAPFDGVVAERMVSEGQFVAVQAPVMRMVRLHPLRLTAQVPERFAPGIRTGQIISLRTDAYPDAPVAGRITRISPDVNLQSRTFSIEAEVPNPDGSLKPGTFARVRIATNRVDQALVVPVSAVWTRYGTSQVFSVRGDKLVGVEVKLGDRLGPRVEILDGLEPGATIVSEGVEGLTAGMRVVPHQAKEPPGTAKPAIATKPTGAAGNPPAATTPPPSPEPAPEAPAGGTRP